MFGLKGMTHQSRTVLCYDLPATVSVEVADTANT